jgi:very-short-patch-repair endonuclease
MRGDDEVSGPLSRSRERARVRARTVRESATGPETLLWYQLRDRRLAGYKFRRQRPIGPYFANFACLDAKLVVEFDGGQHIEAVAYDGARTRAMEGEGFRVLRFWNSDVLTQTDLERDQILRALQTLTLDLSRIGEREQDTSLSGEAERLLQHTKDSSI